MPLGLSYVLWKPVAVIALAGGALAYVRRLGASPWVAVLGLAAFAPLGVLAGLVEGPGAGLPHWARFMAEQMAPLHYLWGNLPAAIAIGLTPLFLLGAERLVNTPGRWLLDRYALGLSAVGLVTAWLHPWQGVIIVMVVVGAALWGRLERRYFVLAVPVAATVAPLAYYFVLQHADDAWNTARLQVATTGFLGFHIVELLVLLGPFVALAAFGVRRPVQDLQERMLLLWPAASFLSYALNGAARYHALGGIALPLAVLCARGWRRFGLPRAASVAAVTLMIVPGLLFMPAKIGHNIHNRAKLYWLYPDEASAIHYLASAPRPGGILSSHQLSPAAVAMTGRQAWVGHPTWTPHYSPRALLSLKLFAGDLSRRDARRLVARSRARYVLSGCPAKDPVPELGAMVVAVKRFGCVSVIEVRPGSGS
jgi:hypothetical protein